MFLLKYFKGFLVIQCTRLLCTHLLCIHYKVDLYIILAINILGVKCDKVVDFPKSSHIYPWQACIIYLPAVSLLILLLICYFCIHVFFVVSITTAWIIQSFFDLCKSLHKDSTYYSQHDVHSNHDTFRHRVICLLCLT